MDTAISCLDGETYIPSEISPKLAEQMLLVCPQCGKPVFPIWGKKVKDHFKHFHNEDIDCDLYYPSNLDNPKQSSGRLRYFKSHSPILQRMISRQFYSLIFVYTDFSERGDLVTEHLGNALMSKTRGTRTGVEAIEKLKGLTGFALISRDLQEAGHWDLEELAQLISMSFTHATAETVWNHLIEAELKHYQAVKLEKLKAGDLGVAQIADAAESCYAQVKHRTNPKVLQLIIDFLKQKRHLPIVKDLVKLAYANAVFPKSPEIAEIAKRSGWSQPQPSDIKVSTFFAELMGLYLVKILISVPWIEFAHRYHKNLPSGQIEAILVPQLLIPGIIVHPMNLND